MSRWLCPICNTLNITEFLKDSYYQEKCKTCNIRKTEYYDRYFEHCLLMNELIDVYFPRIEMEYLVGGELVNRIGAPKFYYATAFHYIVNRITFRNYHANKKWKRRVCNRKFVKIILNEINKRNSEQIDNNLILQFLF